MKIKKQAILIIMALLGAAALIFQSSALAKSKIRLNQRRFGSGYCLCDKKRKSNRKKNRKCYHNRQL